MAERRNLQNAIKFVDQGQRQVRGKPAQKYRALGKRLAFFPKQVACDFVGPSI
jgi:hypothetical protein